MARRLNPEEAELWRRVARSARRLHAARLRPAPDADPRTGPLADPAPPAPVSPAAMAPPQPKPAAPPMGYTPPPRPSVPKVTLDLAPDPRQALAEAPLRMDAGVHARLKRGKIAPEGRIDLHGMTLAQAQPALSGFILWAQGRGMRLVLVITGKGRGDGPRPLGALRREVPHWLRSGAMAGVVLDIREAHPRHGGGGALYVWLRRAPGTA